MIKIECEEKDIEDFLCADINKHLSLKLIGRQISTPAGVIDVLAYSKEFDIYFVIELKKNYLNTSAFAQVIRYSNFLNCTLSKGRRVFVPLLIGMHLHEELEKSVFLYKDNCVDKNSFWKVYYTLFNLSPDKGITFNWHNAKQYKYEIDNLSYDSMNYLEKRDDELCDQSYEIYRLKQFIEENGVGNAMV